MHGDNSYKLAPNEALYKIVQRRKVGGGVVLKKTYPSLGNKYTIKSDVNKKPVDFNIEHGLNLRV